MWVEPRRFSPGAIIARDRGARLAARLAFVELKLGFLDALAEVPDVGWLRTQVRSAEEPVDLWLLRAPVFAALAGAANRPRRQALRRGLDSIFPDLDLESSFVPD